MKRAVPATLLLVVLSLGCCLLPGFVWEYATGAGTFADDAGNWKRIFGQEKPKDVRMLRSWYWQSPHWSLEFEYFLLIAPNDNLRDELTESLVPSARKDPFGEPPTWFLPKPATSYEVWAPADEHRHFQLFIDTETGELFLTCYSV